MKPEPFTVNIPQEKIDDLKSRISKSRLPDEIINSNWQYGASLSYMKEFLNYWETDFDWRKEEEKINSYNNFIATIEGLKIHFIHVKGKGSKPTPIVITHGWPGSFLEMMKLIPLLSDPTKIGYDIDQSFDVVIPSMPGFGFSERAVMPGMNVFRMAELWVQLMQSLGYQKFAAQGGDFGAGVTSALGLRHSDNLIGIHLNYIPGSYRPYFTNRAHEITDEEIQFEKNSDKWYQDFGGYIHQQKTRPLTLAYGLNDSPAGLAAWILEKYYEWGDCQGNVETRFSKDELLANISLYWFTETIHSSVRLYLENSKVPFLFREGEYINVPCGISHFPFEDPFPPRKYIERSYNIRHWTEMPSGGHFASMEEPGGLAKDIIDFFQELR